MKRISIIVLLVTSLVVSNTAMAFSFGNLFGRSASTEQRAESRDVPHPGDAECLLRLSIDVAGFGEETQFALFDARTTVDRSLRTPLYAPGEYAEFVLDVRDKGDFLLASYGAYSDRSLYIRAAGKKDMQVEDEGRLEVAIPFDRRIAYVTIRHEGGTERLPVDGKSLRCESPTAIQPPLKQYSARQDAPTSQRVGNTETSPFGQATTGIGDGGSTDFGGGGEPGGGDGGYEDQYVYNEPLYVSCSSEESEIEKEGTLKWFADVSGGKAPYRYAWTGTDALSGNRDSVAKKYTRSGFKEAVVTVRDASGEAVEAFCGEITVYEPEEAPSADFTVSLTANGAKDISVLSGSAVTLSWSAVGAVGYCKASWTSVAFSGTGTVTIRPTVSDTYTITCVSRDSDEVEAADSVNIDVMKSGKAPSVSSASGPTRTVTGRTTEWFVKAKDADDTSLTLFVRWGDGETESASMGSEAPGETAEVELTHTYLDPGSYVIVFEVEDEDGFVGRTTRNITVTQAPAESPESAE